MSTTYEAVRNRAALFDFSSENRFFVSGEGAVDAVNALIASDLEASPEFKALNTVVLDESGAILAIVWILKTEEGIWMLCDPDRVEPLGTQLAQSAAEHDAKVDDRTETTQCLSLIGPDAQKISMVVAGDDVIGLPYLGFEMNEQIDALICRLGYTGEFEYRYIVSSDKADNLRSLLMKAGVEYGLEMGDSSELPLLMLEMRSLSQHEHIPNGLSPIQAGIHWMIDFRKENYPGHDAVHEQKKNPGRKAVLLLMDIAPPSAIEDKNVYIEQKEVGHCVFFVVSPTIGKTIALAYVDAELAWVSVVFEVAGVDAMAVSAPLFITKTVATS